jgi:hypothetical protein
MLAPASQLQVTLGHLPRLLDESVKGIEFFFVDADNHAGDPPAR